MSIKAYFSIRSNGDSEYTWPEPLGDKCEASIVIEDVGEYLECGRMLATVDNYPYIVLECFCCGQHFAVEHRHSRLYWDGCVWTRSSIEDIHYELPDRVRLCVNGQFRQEIDYEQFARVVRNTKTGEHEPQYKCSVAITDPRVRFLALASLSYLDEKSAKARCALYKQSNPTREESLAVLRRFGLDVGFGPNKADEDTVYGHLNDFFSASKDETPAQILGRTIPLRVECHEPVEHGNLDAGSLALSLGNEQTGVVLRGVETIGAVRKTYAFRVQTEWAQKNVVNVIEKMSVSPTMPTDREGCPSRNEIRIIKGDGVFSLAWGAVIGGTWHPLHRMAKKLRLVYDMLKEDAVAGIDESEPRLVGEFKIAKAHLKDYNESLIVFPPGMEVSLSRDPNDEKTVLVQKSEGEDVLGIVSPSFGNIMDRIRDNCHDIRARIESPCSHQGKPSACVVVVSKK